MIHNSRGLTYLRLGNPIEAIACYNKAIEMNKNCASAYLNKGIALIQLMGTGKNELIAIEEFDKALVIDPNYTNAFYNKALALQTLGRTQEAIEYYHLAIKSNPHDYYIYSNLGVALADLGKKQEALDAFNIALCSDPDDIVARIGKANLLDKYQEASNPYNQASPSRLDDTVICTNKADVEANIKYESEIDLSHYCVIAQMPNIDYDNKLLNHPNLFTESSKYFGLYRAIDLSQQLSSTIINEILVSQDSELLLAGLISLDN